MQQPHNVPQYSSYGYESWKSNETESKMLQRHLAFMQIVCLFTENFYLYLNCCLFAWIAHAISVCYHLPESHTCVGRWIDMIWDVRTVIWCHTMFYCFLSLLSLFTSMFSFLLCYPIGMCTSDFLNCTWKNIQFVSIKINKISFLIIPRKSCQMDEWVCAWTQIIKSVDIFMWILRHIFHFRIYICRWT